MLNLGTNEKAMLDIIRAAFFGEEFHLREDADYRCVLSEMMDQRIVQLMNNVAQAFSQDKALQAKIHELSIGSLIYGSKVQAMEFKVNQYLEEAGVPAVVLKGSAISRYYPHGVDRIYGDVDIFAQPCDYKKAMDALKAKGGEEVDIFGEDPRNGVILIDKIEIEVHHHFFEHTKDEWNEVLFDCISRRKKIQNPAGEIYVFPELENGLVELQHLKQHIQGGIGLRQIIDWLGYVNAVCDDTFWNEKLKPLAEKLSLVKLAKGITKLGKVYMGLPDRITWCDDVEEQLVDDLMRYALDSGNFGHKSDDDVIILNIVSQKKNLKEWFEFLQYQGVQNLPKNHQGKLAVKFAWAYQIGRYAKRGLSGNRFLKFVSGPQRKEAKRKKKLFTDLDI